MPYRVVLFDLDGTLVDSIELIVRAAQHAFGATLGRVPAREEIMAGIGKPLMTQFGTYAESREQLDALIQSYRTYQLAHHDDLTRPYDGVVDAVRWLSDEGRALGVVTSKIEPLAHRALSHVGLDPFFDLVVGIESTTRHKPDPEPLLFAMEQLDADPDETVYVGDSPFDLQAARAARVASIAVTWGAFHESSLLAERPTLVVRSAAELRSRLV
jgi:pyrophosphatase PpaX